MEEGIRRSSPAIEEKENVKIEALLKHLRLLPFKTIFECTTSFRYDWYAETEAGEFWEIYKLDVVTIPTNKPIIRDDRDDLVYKTNREKYNAVIEEIVKLTDGGRPVLVGTTSVEISELLGRILKLEE